MIRHPPISTLLPYTTLFRSQKHNRLLEPRGTELRQEDRDAQGDRGGDRQRQNRRVQRAPDERERAKLAGHRIPRDRKSTRLNSSHSSISYAVFCLKKKIKKT